MKKILAIIKKDTLIRFTSPVEWLFFLVMPMVFILILSGGTGPPGDQRITLLTVDLARSELSAALVAELEKSPSVRPELTDLADALGKFDAFQVSAVLIIPEDFTSEVLQRGEAAIELKQQQNNLNALVDQQAVQTAVLRISSLVDIANASLAEADSIRPFDSDTERQAYFNHAFSTAGSLMADAPQRVNAVVGATQDQINYDPRANSVAGQMITWVFIPLIGLSAMFAMERTGGTLRRLLVTPTSKARYIGGTVVGQVLTALLQMALLITFGVLVLQIDWGRSPLALVLVMLTSALAAASLGTMLGTFVKTEGQANGLSIMIGMVMAMMGGCWYPIELFPQAIRTAAQALPTYWAMSGFLNIAVRGQGLSGVLLECGILLGFALVFFLIGVWRFKYE
ncbi:MAG: ABC transporter permease [Brevefilum sp.]|nr:ABC transporter permease [Brevefilum sp.]